METMRSNAGNKYIIGAADSNATPASIVPSSIPTNAGPNFGTNSWGQSYGVATVFGDKATPLAPNGGLFQINSNTNLTGLTGNKNQNGYVQQVYIQPNLASAYWQFTIWVYGAGPTVGTGTLNLAFQDLSFDTYSLALFSSSPSWHYVQYTSSLPQIINFSWNPTYS